MLFYFRVFSLFFFIVNFCRMFVKYHFSIFPISRFLEYILQKKLEFGKNKSDGTGYTKFDLHIV